MQHNHEAYLPPAENNAWDFIQKITQNAYKVAPDVKTELQQYNQLDIAERTEEDLPQSRDLLELIALFQATDFLLQKAAKCYESPANRLYAKVPKVLEHAPEADAEAISLQGHARVHFDTKMMALADLDEDTQVAMLEDAGPGTHAGVSIRAKLAKLADFEIMLQDLMEEAQEELAEEDCSHSSKQSLRELRKALPNAFPRKINAQVADIADSMQQWSASMDAFLKEHGDQFTRKALHPSETMPEADEKLWEQSRHYLQAATKLAAVTAAFAKKAEITIGEQKQIAR